MSAEAAIESPPELAAQDGPEPDQGDDEPRFTQADIDHAIRRRLGQAQRKHDREMAKSIDRIRQLEADNAALTGELAAALGWKPIPVDSQKEPEQ